MRTGNLVTRLQAKYNALQKAVGEDIYDVPPTVIDRLVKASMMQCDFRFDLCFSFSF